MACSSTVTVARAVSLIARLLACVETLQIRGLQSRTVALAYNILEQQRPQMFRHYVQLVQLSLSSANELELITRGTIAHVAAFQLAALQRELCNDAPLLANQPHVLAHPESEDDEPPPLVDASSEE